MEYLLYGFDESECPLPCETFSTKTRLMVSTNTQDYTGIVLDFQQNVEVKSDKMIYVHNIHAHR